METNKEGDVTLSVVMPAYNEGAHITDNLLETSRVLSGFVKRYEIIAVDDGSADNTAECIRRAEMQDTHIRGISYQPNGGKGHAIRTGIAAAEGRYIAFLDSDLELPPILLKRFLKDMKEQDADIVIGSKLHPESKLHYPMLRKIMSYGYYLMLKMITHDTQTGIKLFKKEVIKPIVGQMQAEGYAFDIEILAMAAKDGRKICEAPIELNYSRDDSKGGRRIGLKDVFKVFGETVAVKKRVKNYR